jgi:succinyl-CoA synthetase beta subunit
MNLHEYQAKDLFRVAGIPVQPQEVADGVERAVTAAARIGYPVVIKAQVHSGGRGKAGGVKLAKDAKQAREHAGAILGMDIKGHRVRKVLIAPAAEIEREYYAGVVLDRGRRCPVLMVSAEGGVDIEEVARTSPEKIFTVPLPDVNLPAFRAREVAFAMERQSPIATSIAGILVKLVRLYRERDASLVEINPLAVTAAGDIVALDAKLVADDSGLFRQPEIDALRDVEEEGEEENRARENDLSYIGLSGTIGCLVNGAGLAMATMDVIKHFGGEPANFLDIGGSSRPEKVTAAMDILGRASNVRSILINIFGGITRCDDVARGLAAALKGRPAAVPLVIRLTGTNEKAARQILAGELPKVKTAETMDEAVRAAVALAGSGSR